MALICHKEISSCAGFDQIGIQQVPTGPDVQGPLDDKDERIQVVLTIAWSIF